MSFIDGKLFEITEENFERFKVSGVSFEEFDTHMMSCNFSVITFCVSLNFTKDFLVKLKENEDIFNRWQMYEERYDREALHFRSNKELIEMIVKFGYSRALKKPCPNSFQAIPEHLLPYVKVKSNPEGWSDFIVLTSDNRCDKSLYKIVKNLSWQYYNS